MRHPVLFACFSMSAVTLFMATLVTSSSCSNARGLLGDMLPPRRCLAPAIGTWAKMPTDKLLFPHPHTQLLFCCILLYIHDATLLRIHKHIILHIHVSDGYHVLYPYPYIVNPCCIPIHMSKCHTAASNNKATAVRVIFEGLTHGFDHKVYHAI